MIEMGDFKQTEELVKKNDVFARNEAAKRLEGQLAAANLARAPRPTAQPGDNVPSENPKINQNN